MTASARLAIDFGTSHTVAVLDPGTGIGQPLLFGDTPLLPSAVHAAGPGQLLTGRDAIRAARTAPECFEPNPKRRIDDGSILLGTEEYPVAALIAAVLKTVATEARRVAGGEARSVALTHPANWGNTRLSLLRKAAAEAGLGHVQLVPEPEAAAEYFTKSEPAARLPETVVVYDFGGGTFDTCVLRLSDGEYQVKAQAGLDDIGGADLDAALMQRIGVSVAAVDAGAWQRITHPDDPTTRRAFRALYEDVKDTKEQLSRNSSGLVHIPMLDRDFPVTREEFERVATPLIVQTVDLTASTLAKLGIAPGQPLSLYLVGGSSRVPLVSTLLHRKLMQAPVVTGQPEQVVALGALLRLRESTSVTPRELPIVSSTPPAPVPPRADHVAPIPASMGRAPLRPSPPKPPAAAPVRQPPVRATPPAAAPPRRVPPPASRPAPPPSPPRRSRRGLGVAIVLVLLLVMAGGGYYLWTKTGGFGTDSANGDQGEQGGGSGGNVSNEPDPQGFDECVYFESMEDHTLVSAACDGGSASHGVTRNVKSKCGAPIEEDYGYFGDRGGVFCVTELFEVDTCLNHDFNTTPCREEASAYVITEGPLSKNTCADSGYAESVRLKKTGQFFCLDANNGG